MISRRFKQKIKIEWSSNFAYAIGLITSDGNLSNDGRHISFVSKDLELVTKFIKSLNITNRIKKAARGGETEKKYYVIRFGDKIFYQFLNSIGLTSAKSRTIKQVEIPNQYFADFLRGLFDGDGTFYIFWDKRWPIGYGFKMSFASASPIFISWLKDCLTKLYLVTGSIHKGAGVLNLEYTKGDTKKLFATMYYKKGLLFFSQKYFKILIALEQDKLLGFSSLQKQRAKPR